MQDPWAPCPCDGNKYHSSHEYTAPADRRIQKSHQSARQSAELMLKARDPAVQPEIHLNFFADGEDLGRAIDGVRRAWHVLHTESMINAYQAS
jgi:hypothetical protein